MTNAPLSLQHSIKVIADGTILKALCSIVGGVALEEEAIFSADDFVIVFVSAFGLGLETKAHSRYSRWGLQQLRGLLLGPNLFPHSILLIGWQPKEKFEKSVAGHWSRRLPYKEWNFLIDPDNHPLKPDQYAIEANIQNIRDDIKNAVQIATAFRVITALETHGNTKVNTSRYWGHALQVFQLVKARLLPLDVILELPPMTEWIEKLRMAIQPCKDLNFCEEQIIKVETTLKKCEDLSVPHSMKERSELITARLNMKTVENSVEALESVRDEVTCLFRMLVEKTQ